MRYCQHCFGVGQRCQCSAVPHQAPGLTMVLWVPPMMTYVDMASSIETTASSSAAGVTHPSHLPPGRPATEPMDTFLAPTTKNLLATAGIGRGLSPRMPPRVPAAPGLCQMRPQVTPRQVPTPAGQGMTQGMPYCQQAFPPKCLAPSLSTAPSTSQDHGGPAREEKSDRGRSSS